MGRSWTAACLAAAAVCSLAACGRYGFTPTPDPGDLAVETVEPTVGPIDADTLITVSGRGFTEELEIVIGDTPCTNPEAVSSTQLTCTARRSTAGLADVELIRRDGATATLPSAFLYYEPNAPDPTFGDGGIVVADISGANDSLWDRVVVLADDRILLSGESTINGGRQPLLARYTIEGVLDPTFGDAGTVRESVPGLDQSWLCDHQLDSEGRILAVGNGFIPGGNMVTHLARFTADGQLDASFGTDGFVVFQMGVSADHTCQLEIAPTGEIYVGGHTDNATDKELQLHRLLPNGSPDLSFGTEGRAVADVGISELSFDFALLPDRLVMGVQQSPSVRLVAFTLAGVLDNGFGSGGILDLPAGPDSAGINRLRRLDDNSLLIAGVSRDAATSTGNDGAVWHVFGDGRIDTSFGANGVALLDVGAGSEVAYDVIEQLDGRLVVVGDHRVDDVDALVLRLQSNGTPDDSFGDTGSFVMDVSGGLDRMFAVERDSYGRIIATGQSEGASGRDILLLRYWP